MVQYDIAIVGGGCIGLSIGKHLAEQSEYDICILEKEHHFAEHQSGRNSGVLHPGFNYRPESLKAKFSTLGTAAMKEYCRANDLPLAEVGVIVIAKTPAEEDRLYDIQRQADENGVETEILESPEEIHDYEPHAAGHAALYCPEAASVDAQQYVYSLARDIDNMGVEVHMGYEVQELTYTECAYRISTDKGQITTDYIVNAAGLHADRLAHQVGIGEEYQIIPFRGEYYELVPECRDLVNSMVYPTPDPELPFLGVHFTRRTDGKVIVGPNAVLAFGREAYENTDFDMADLREMATYPGLWRLLASPKMLSISIDELNKSYRKEKFVEASRELLPEVTADDFVKSYAGIRAQMVSDDGDLIKDPVFEHGPQSTHVLNAVSPGLTSSLPFGEHLANEVLDRR